MFKKSIHILISITFVLVMLITTVIVGTSLLGKLASIICFPLGMIWGALGMSLYLKLENII